MGHHLDDTGCFQSDRYPEIGPDKVVLSLHDPAAQVALLLYCEYSEPSEFVSDLGLRTFDLYADRLARKGNDDDGETDV